MGVRPLAIRWADPAETSLDAMLSFIAIEDVEAARRLYKRVMEAVAEAARFPERSRAIPELGRTYRELLSVKPFRVIYRIEGKELRIIGVMRMEQDFRPLSFLDPG